MTNMLLSCPALIIEKNLLCIEEICVTLQKVLPVFFGLFGGMYASTFTVEVTKRLCSSETLVNTDSYFEITKHESSQK